MQEFFLQVESSVTNKILAFVMDILQIFSTIGEVDVMTSVDAF